MRDFLKDVRFGLRMLLRQPLFTLAAVLTLALGIGANTAIFSVVNGVLLRPLPYTDPERLVAVWSTGEGEREEGDSSYLNFTDWREQTRSFEGMAAYRSWYYTLTGMGDPRRVVVARVTAGFFPLLGVSPFAGRTFLPEEERPNSERVAVISYEFWQRDFGGDRAALGRQLTLNTQPYTIVGILPRGFRPPLEDEGEEVYTTVADEKSDLAERGAFVMTVLGRLKPGVTLEQAQGDIGRVAGDLARQYPDVNAKTTAYVVGLHEQQVGKIQTALWILFGAVGLVLLIACSNVANLLLARAAARQKEMAIRTALGAGRWRIVRQLLTESLLLAALAGVAGVLLALWGVDTLVALGPESLPRLGEVHADASVFGFALLLSTLTGVLFGLAPALKASRPELEETLREGGRGSTAGRNRQRLRGLLIVSETALALVLLVCAGLLVKSFVRLVQVDPGFKPENVMTLSVSLTVEKYKDPTRRVAFVEQSLERVRAVPGVSQAAFTARLPFSNSDALGNFEIVGRPAPRNSSEKPLSNMRTITPDYFRVMGIPLRAGRYFNSQDRKGGTGAAIVNESLARRYWPDKNPVGQHIRGVGINLNGDEPPEWEIVGVVGDVHHTGLDKKPEPALYFPYEQNTWSSGTFVVRTTVEPSTLAAALRREVMSVDKDQPVVDVQPLTEMISESVAQPRFYMILLGAFSAVGLVLALIGIYGVVSYAVTERTHEMGIRLALGATPADVLRLMIRHGMFFALAGIAIGIAGAFAATRYMSALLFGVAATDSLVFAGVPVLLAAVALAACYVPARRATKVDPMVALRYE
jgi:putative ABC transport system permease protein